MRRSILNKYIVGLAFILLVVSSCKTKKNIYKSVDNKPVSAIINFKDIKEKEVAFETFATKAKAKISFDGKGYDATLNLRIKKDEIIWASVTYIAGIEVARIFITPDSVKFLNRITSEYLVKPFSFIHNYTSEEIDFASLQALFLGNSFPFVLNNNNKINRNGNVFTIDGKLKSLSFNNEYLSELKLSKSEISNPAQQQELTVLYDDFVTIKDNVIPSKVSIKSKINAKTIDLNLGYQNPELEIDQDYPFSVSKRFTIIE
jgi:hypothetical protein